MQGNLVQTDSAITVEEGGRGLWVVCSRSSADPGALQGRAKRWPQEGAYECSGCDRQSQIDLRGSVVNQVTADPVAIWHSPK